MNELLPELYDFCRDSKVVSVWRLIGDLGTGEVKTQITDTNDKKVIINALLEESAGKSYDTNLIDFILDFTEDGLEKDLYNIQYMRNSKFDSSHATDRRDRVIKDMLTRCSNIDIIAEYIEENFKEYRSWPVVLVNPNLSSDEKRKIIKKYFRQKDLPAYCEFLKFNLKDLNDLETFIDIAVINNNRVLNKEAAFEDIFIRTLCSGGRGSYYLYGSFATHKYTHVSEFFTKYKDTYLSVKSLDGLIGRWCGSPRGADLIAIAKYLHLEGISVKEKLKIVNETNNFSRVFQGNKEELLKDALNDDDNETLELTADFYLLGRNVTIGSLVGCSRSWYRGWYKGEGVLTIEQVINLLNRYPGFAKKIEKGKWMSFDGKNREMFYTMLETTSIKDLYEKIWSKLPEELQNENWFPLSSTLGTGYQLEQSDVNSYLGDMLALPVAFFTTYSLNTELKEFFYKQVFSKFTSDEHVDAVLKLFSDINNDKNLVSSYQSALGMSLGSWITSKLIPAYTSALEVFNDVAEPEELETIKGNLDLLATDIELFTCI